MLRDAATGLFEDVDSFTKVHDIQRRCRRLEELVDTLPRQGDVETPPRRRVSLIIAVVVTVILVIALMVLW